MVIITRIAATVPVRPLPRPLKRFLRGALPGLIISPMASAPEIEHVASGLFIWRVYDPAIKAELFSTGLRADSGTYLLDPIPLAPDAMAEIRAMRKVAGIVLTNENHDRAATYFAETFKAPIYRNGTLAVGTLTPIQIEGGPAGEIAIYSSQGNGTMVIGDALINFDPYGFAFLPAKYCMDAKAMRRSLKKLLDYSFERLLFAHGMPILKGARERLEHLLNEDR